MKKLLGVLLCLFFLGGCATTSLPAPPDSKTEVYLDPSYGWTNKPFGEASPARSITLRVINRRYIEVKVSVACSCGSTVYGNKDVEVDARDEKVFTVMVGVSTTGELTCGILKVQ